MLRRTVELVALLFEAGGTFGIVVLIRTFLSFSLEIELEGRWPWQSPREAR